MQLSTRDIHGAMNVGQEDGRGVRTAARHQHAGRHGAFGERPSVLRLDGRALEMPCRHVPRVHGVRIDQRHGMIAHGDVSERAGRGKEVDEAHVIEGQERRGAVTRDAHDAPKEPRRRSETCERHKRLYRRSEARPCSLETQRRCIPHAHVATGCSTEQVPRACTWIRDDLEERHITVPARCGRRRRRRRRRHEHVVERHVRDTPSVGQRHDEAVQALRPHACPRQRPGGARGREQRRREGTGYRHDDMRHGRPILDMEGRAQVHHVLVTHDARRRA